MVYTHTTHATHGRSFEPLVHIALQTVRGTLFLKLLHPFSVDLHSNGAGLGEGFLLEDPAHVVEQFGNREHTFPGGGGVTAF